MQLNDHNKRRMLIDGELTGSAGGQWLPSVNPATEEIIGHIPAGNAEDVERAAAAAERAYPAWQALGIEGRAERMREVARRLTEAAEAVLAVEVADTGNTVTALKDDVAAAAWGLNFYAGLGYELKGETIPATADSLHFTVREPYGVVGRIVPFNHPILFAAARTAAALIAGNALVVKPPETSSLSATMLAEICKDVLPPGVMNIVTGLGKDAGDAIARNPRIKRIAFIGSPNTGRQIQKSAADVCVKHISLELGGKNPLIVFPDADLEAAKDAAVRGMNFLWQGQSCGSTSRLLVHDSIYDEFVEGVAERVARIRLGDPRSMQSDMGPINSRAQYQRVCDYVEIAKRDGARLVTGAERPAGESFARGYWIEPTVFADVLPHMRIAQEEVFGPILSIMRWSTPDEALRIANGVEYGLTASIWTRDIQAALATATRLRTGYIWVNGVGAHYKGVPYGGYRNSGVGREEGIEEMLSYTETKAINLVGPFGFA
ncbi:aldehyde dehydrogenase family protein [Cupriavidus sp. CV2]|uniref:aldehyde dehydrogenase family protein n=1 Tax=Cupriavidus ulmosensis TaxID=3065913 RepID=UPI00296AC303|nr:aldehyde dehydrogenase family protein [Cupriavidus sp. CV2]MDW3686619.1 aldehyde dehydrogenase family protein [Cupriavidus sp. CV2]